MFEGIEVDVIALGDADCLVVTKWHESYPHRILIDGGNGTDAERIAEFLLHRGYTDFWAAVCTHLHNDHARGLIQLVRDSRFCFHNGWMHDIRNHVNPSPLQSACKASDGVKEVLETTKELAAAFAARRIRTNEPFSTAENPWIAGYPSMLVLGPSETFYKQVIKEFTNVAVPAPAPLGAMALSHIARTMLAATPSGPLAPRYPTLPTMLSANYSIVPAVPPPLTGVLSNSSVKKNPTTQPYNNTSVILGVQFGVQRLLFAADAGTDALAAVSRDWNHLLYLGVPHHGSDGNLSQGDIERFCPKFALISAKGDSSHPSRKIVSALVKVGAVVGSTHEHGHLWFYTGSVPSRADYHPIVPLRGTGAPEPVIRPPLLPWKNA